MKVSKCLFVVLTVFSVITFAVGEIVIPDNPPEVSGGELTKGGDMANAAVTVENLESEFIPMFLQALMGEEMYDIPEVPENSPAVPEEKLTKPRSVESLPEEYEKYSRSMEMNITVFADVFGRAEMNAGSNYAEEYSETQEYESGYESGAIKFFDYSNSGELFLGGAFGLLSVEEEEGNFTNITMKYNGKVEFAGVFKGKIVFDNVVYFEKHEYLDEGYLDGNGNWIYERIPEQKIISGSFFVECNGKKVADLPAHLLADFDIEGEFDYGNDEITISMPKIPGAPDGNLTERDGETVNPENLNEFFTVFLEEFSNGGYAPRAVNEGNESDEALSHGGESGYYKIGVKADIQANNNGEYFAKSQTVECFDYSNNGGLYFGGGYGKAQFTFYETVEEWSESSEYKLNGKINFNGEFKGTLDFQNFNYTQEFSGLDYINSYTLNGGKVMLGLLDVTEEYFMYVVKGEPIGSVTPIEKVQTRNIEPLFKSTIVSDKMEIILNDYRNISFVVYDMTGNIVADGNGRTWDLRNSAGRFVANGSYLVVVEAKDRNGKVSRYSSKIGVKR